MSDCKTGAEHIKSLKDGRTVYLDGQLRRRRHRASGIPQRRALGRSAVRFSGAAGQHRADDIPAERLQPPGQSRLADAAQLRRDGAAAQGAAGLGRVVVRLLWPFARPSRVRAGRPAHGHRRIPQAQRRARQGLRRIISTSPAKTICSSPTSSSIRRPQRSKDWGEQDEDLVARIVDEDSSGVTIRGAKMLGTSSIMANEVFVANLQPLKAGEEDFAFSCALPMNAKGTARPVAQILRSACRIGLRQPALVAVRRKRRADVFRRRQGAVGAHVRPSRPRHVPRAISRHARARLSELSGADPAVGEDRFPGRSGAPPYRSDRHHQYPVGFRAARHAGGAGRHGRRDAVRHGGIGFAARRMVRAEQAFHVFGAGADAGPLSARGADDPRSRRRRADHAALLRAGFRQSGDGRNHQQDAALGVDAAGAKSEISQGGLGRDRLRIRLAAHAIRDVLCRRALRHLRPQLPHL